MSIGRIGKPDYNRLHYDYIYCVIRSEQDGSKMIKINSLHQPKITQNPPSTQMDPNGPRNKPIIYHHLHSDCNRLNLPAAQLPRSARSAPRGPDAPSAVPGLRCPKVAPARCADCLAVPGGELFMKKMKQEFSGNFGTKVQNIPKFRHYVS